MKVKLPLAVKASQKMPLRNTHVGSTDFFRPFVNYYLETVPKDKIRANIKQFVQAYPLAGANLGQYKHNMYGFYVPYRTVMRDFNDFIVHNEVEYYGTYDTLANTRQIQVGYRPSTPLVTRTDLFYAFMGFQPTNDVYLQEMSSLYINLQQGTAYGIEGDFDNDWFNELSQFLYSYGIQLAQAPHLFSLQTFAGNPLFKNFIILTPGEMESIENSGFMSGVDGFEQFKRRFDVIGTIQVAGQSPSSFYICVNFTPYGRYVYQLLESIGYVITFGGYFSFVQSEDSPSEGFLVANYTWEQSAQGTSVVGGRLNYSALPLMSLYKVFIDWFVPTKFRNRYDIMMQELYKFQYPFRPYIEMGRGYLPFPLIREVLLYTSYQSDYFTDAYLYPNGSNSGESSDITLPDITLGSYANDGSPIVAQPFTNEIQNGVPNTPVLGSSDSGNVVDMGSPVSLISSYALRALNALNNFVRRNQIVGYKTIDRYLAHYGVKLNPAQSYRSILIGSHTEDIIPLNVMSQSDNSSDQDATPETQQSLLGGRASNLIFSHNSKFEYDSADEFGMFLVISTLTPKVGYVDGLDRMILHTTYDSFYQPDFDSLGVQPIIKGELFNRWHYGTDRGNEVFGFTQRYADYKYKQDKLTGDFIFPTRNAFLDSLHTFRRFVTEPDSINNRFLIGDNAEYDRIFVMTTDEYDHFQTVSYNDVTAFRHNESNEDVNDIKDNGRGTIMVHEGGNNILH